MFGYTLWHKFKSILKLVNLKFKNRSIISNFEVVIQFYTELVGKWNGIAFHIEM